MDYDADGDLDILSGSYTGEIYYFERGEDGFAQGRFLLNSAGEPLQTGTSVTPEAIDMDADGDLDLVIGTRTSGVFVVENTGSRSEPSWKPEPSAVRSADGKQLKGSNAHHADWDGDGVRDMIVGAEWGGASWYRNTGTNAEPAYAEAEELLPQRPFEQRTEDQGPTGPGSRTKVFVTDWNDDGKADLLVGDVQWLYYTLPPLTAEQEAEKAELEPAYAAAKKAYYAIIEERNVAVGTADGISDELQARMDAASEVFGPLSTQMSAFDREKSNTHGWVWLYLRVAGDAETGASLQQGTSERSGQ